MGIWLRGLGWTPWPKSPQLSFRELKRPAGCRSGLCMAVPGATARWSCPGMTKTLGRQSHPENTNSFSISVFWQPHAYLVSLNSPRTDPELSVAGKRHVFCAQSGNYQPPGAPGAPLEPPQREGVVQRTAHHAYACNKVASSHGVPPGLHQGSVSQAKTELHWEPQREKATALSAAPVWLRWKDSFPLHTELGKGTPPAVTRVSTSLRHASWILQQDGIWKRWRKNQKNFKILYPPTMHRRTLSRESRQPTAWEKISAHHTATGDAYPEYVMNSDNATTTEQTSNNEQRTCTDVSP